MEAEEKVWNIKVSVAVAEKATRLWIKMKGSFKDLTVYQKAYMKVHRISKSFPKEERYSLTDQIRRSSRSVCANIAEGYRKRRYSKHFTSKMTDADGEASETIVWLDFAKDFKYIKNDNYTEFITEYREVGKMLGSMANNPEKFLPKNIWFWCK